MSDHDTEEKIKQLKNLLEETKLNENEKIIKLINSIIYSDFNEKKNRREEIQKLYNNIFFKTRSGKQSETQLNFEAYKLDINDPDSKIILFNFEKPENAKEISGILESIIESKEGQNYVIPLGHEYIAVVYEMNPGNEIKEFAMAAAESILSECGIKVTVGIGGLYTEIKDAGRSLEEAGIALKAGGKLLNNADVYEYNKLGMARIIYEIPDERCERFINEILSPEAVRELENKEMLESINKLFKNNLNISVAARELYVHRNTMVYRIEKFRKISGYDLLNFEDAALVKFAIIIKRKLLND